MSDPLSLAADALFAELERGAPLWSTSDGHRCYGKDTVDGCTMTVVGAGTELVTRLTGVSLSAFT